jgi:hypothetical protein
MGGDMKKQSGWMLIATLLALVAFLWTANSLAEEEGAKAKTSEKQTETKLKLLPEAVRVVVLAEVGDAEVLDIYETVVDEAKTYLVAWSGEKGVSNEMTVSAKGEILSRKMKMTKGAAAAEDEDDDDEGEIEKEITMDELPDAARATILKEAGDHEIIELEEVIYKDRTFYEAEWLEGGMEVEVAVTPEGEVIGREIETPEGETEEADDD